MDERAIQAASKRLMLEGKSQGALTAELATAKAKVTKLRRALTHLVMNANIAQKKTSLIHAHRMKQIKAEEKKFAAKAKAEKAKALADQKEAAQLRKKMQFWQKKNKAKYIKYKVQLENKIAAMKKKSDASSAAANTASTQVQKLKKQLTKAQAEAAAAEKKATAKTEARDTKQTKEATAFMTALLSQEAKLVRLYAAEVAANDQAQQAAANAAEVHTYHRIL